MSLCIAASGTIIALAANAFTLSWTHSVEKTLWQERWIVANGQLEVIESTVEGSGAGIYLPDNARRTAAGWTYTPSLAPLDALTLAASGMTPSPWTLCTEARCLDLGAEPGDIVTLWSAPQCDAPPDD